MNGKLILYLVVPGVLLGILITFGILQNLFFISVLSLILVITYPFIVIAGGHENYALQVFLAVYLCFSFITWVPVEEYVSFSLRNPERHMFLNEVYRHPRRMLFIIGQAFAFASAIIAVLIAVLFDNYLEAEQTH